MVNARRRLQRLHLLVTAPMKEDDERRLKSPAACHVAALAVQFVLLIVLLGGRELEQSHIRRLPGTSSFYETEHVCGLELPEYEYAREVMKRRNQTTDNNIRTATKRKLYLSDKEFGVQNESLHFPMELELSNLFTNTSVQQHPASAMLIETYMSADVARSQGTIVQHCGDCGQCSNPQDIAIYDDTKNTLFRSSLQCSKVAFWQGRQSASECLAKAVGFTDGCNDCWVDNMMCTIRSCMFTCAWTAMFTKIKAGSAVAGDSPQQLNDCLKCDERRCGPAFLQCAGANRRRVGILSDIQRNDREECAATDEDWWKSESLQTYYRLSKTHEFVKE